jgi:SOS response regulatory protein OraA/RecX
LTENSADAAWQTALKLLARRDFTVEGLVARLQRRGHSESASRAATERCAGYGYVDDHAFGMTRAQNRLQRQPGGRRALVQDLRRQGLTPTMAQQVADEAYAEAGGEPEVLDRALRRWVERHGEPEDWRAAKRCADHLARRGFAAADVRSALSPWLDELSN